jgi:hypothetical protein
VTTAEEGGPPFARANINHVLVHFASRQTCEVRKSCGCALRRACEQTRFIREQTTALVK